MCLEISFEIENCPNKLPRLQFYCIISALFIFIYVWGWNGTKCSGTRPFIGQFYQAWIIHYDDCGAISGIDELCGNPKYPENTYLPKSALSACDRDLAHD
jgi:hypothetical protein